MTKILYVHGDDYAALDFERLRDEGVVDPADLWAKANAGGSGEYVSEQEFFEYEALEFGTIDPKFIEWVQYEQDHDESKSRNFYVVED